MESSATRLTAKKILGQISPSARKQMLTTVVCLAASATLAFLPKFDGLASQGVNAFFILLFCAGLWATESMPAFAVALLAIGLEIALLGHVGSSEPDWEKYVATWGDPLIWLFFAGFILAAAAKKTGLDNWMASLALRVFGQTPALLLLGVMLTTAVLSMFLSNTATATMMLAILGPTLIKRHKADRKPRAMLLGLAMAANIGGMGTVIGTPPNAIAAGALEHSSQINFLEWMIFGIPPAVALLIVAWLYLLLFYLGRDSLSSKDSSTIKTSIASPDIPELQQGLVIGTFAITVLVWITAPLHGIPTTAASFIPICVLTATGTLNGEDVQSISWDVLLLIAGGLSLGVAIRDSGLAEWIVGLLPLSRFGPVIVAVILAFVATLLSNLMSNTAAANVIIPIAVVLLGFESSYLVVPIALSASAAMCLPISTPPNAIVYGTGQLRSRDLLLAGLMMALLTPPTVVAWSHIIMQLGWIE